MTTSHLVAAVLGAVLVSGAWLWTGALDRAPEPGPETAPVGASPDTADVLARLDRIERALEDLAARPVAAAGTSSGPVLEGAPVGDAPPPTAPSVAIPEDVLERTLERIEERRLAGKSVEALRTEARRLIRVAKDPAGAHAVLTHLLQRDLEPKQRLGALVDLGAVQREQGDYEASEKSFQEVMRLSGEDSKEGVAAAYQLVWTQGKAERPLEALETADRALRHARAYPEYHPWMRWAAAKMAFTGGLLDRARTDYEALLSEFAESPAHASLIKDARATLQQMDAR